MSALTTVVAAFMLALIAMSFAFAGGAVIVAIPVAIIGVGIAAAMDFNKRRKQATTLHDQRERARTDKVNFTERDEQTLVSE
jgi:predicted membrane protein